MDTHGVTHFALATVKLLGFDLLPRLANLADRKLYLLQGVKVPAGLEPMVKRVKITPMAPQVSSEENTVTFRWRDYRHGNASRLMSLHPDEFSVRRQPDAA